MTRVDFKKYLPWLVIPLVSLGLFAAPVFRNQTIVPGDILPVLDTVWSSNAKAKNALLSDVLFQFYPWQTFAFDQLRAGHLPLWNPYELSGTPFVANDQSAVFDPVRLVFTASGISASGAFLWAAILRLALFGWFLALFLRRHDFSDWASVGIASIGMVAAPNIAWISYPLFAVFMWLPLLLLGIHDLRNHPRRGLILLAIGTAGHALSGNIQMSLFITLAAAVYALVVLRSWKKYVLALGGFFLGAMIAAVQLLPAAQFITQSNQYETGRSGYATTSFMAAMKNGSWLGWRSAGDVRSAVATILPLFSLNVHGNPAGGAYRFPAKNLNNNFNELAVSIGLIGLWLAGLGAWRFWRERLVKFAVWTSGVSLGIMTHAPFFEMINYVPFIRQTSTGRLRFVLAFMLVILAAYGARSLKDIVLKRQKMFVGLSVAALWLIAAVSIRQFAPAGGRQTEYLFLAISALAPTMFFLPKLAPKWKIFGVVALAVLIPAWQLRGQNPGIDQAALYPQRNIIDLARSVTPSNYRLTGLATETRRAPLLPNGSILFGLNDIRGYEVVRLKRYDRLAQSFITRAGSYLKRITGPHPLLDVFAVRTVLVPKADEPAAGPEFTAAGWIKQGESDGIALYINPTARPRAYTVTQPTEVATAEDAWTNMTTAPKNVVIETGRRAEGAQATVTPAVISSETPNAVTVQANAAQDGFLVLSDSYADGWKTTVDGRPAKIYPANYAFRAVAIPAGAHTVKFLYRPPAFIVGAWVSLSGLVILIGLIVAGNKNWRNAIQNMSKNVRG